jgi:hypothetical protein
MASLNVDDLLCELVDELVDAHQETVRMVVDGAGQERWHADVDYLRALQRLGHEALAAIELERAVG